MSGTSPFQGTLHLACALIYRGFRFPANRDTTLPIQKGSEGADSIPVASAGAFFSVRVDTFRTGKREKVGMKFGPWHNRHGRSVAYRRTRE
jgi:hypothetical protein